jgi:hypothetical protein
MAKKATRSKKASSTKAKKASSSKAKQRITVPVESVVHFVKLLHDEGHAEDFIKGANRSKAVVTLRANSVNFVRKLLIRKNVRTAMAKGPIDPCGGDPFRCFR